MKTIKKQMNTSVKDISKESFNSKNHLRKIVLTLLGILSIAIGIKGQTLATSTDIPQVMKPSPKATSMMRYGEYPVSLYTGLVDITIPVYTIERKGLKIPIELKYHSSGIKYDDVSGEVGLGWSLIAGGVITLTVKGQEDGIRNSKYAKNTSLINPCNSISTTNDYLCIREVENGSRNVLGYDNSIEKKDGEIDIYSFSFLNHSGSFCFPAEEFVINSSVPPNGLFIPNNGMKVTSSSGNKIELYDADGNYYKFEVKDTHYNSVHHQKLKEYYLTQIISADKADKITFTYDNMSSSIAYIRQPFINYSATIGNIAQVATPEKGLNTHDVRFTEFGGLFYNQLRPARLKRIDFNGGYADFVYHNASNKSPWDLNEIRIINNNSSVIKRVSLVKSKFANGEDRLDKVVFLSSNNESYEYKMGYNGEPGNIYSPGPYGKGIDYWGYYNGNYVPYGKRYVPKLPNMDKRIEGTDRRANVSVMQLGVLNKITYPTKGYTEFLYEANKIRYSLGAEIQTAGGLRIREIKNYLPDGTLAEKKWYKYGSNESGYGSTYVYMDIEDFRINRRKLVFWGSPITNPHIVQTVNMQTFMSFPKRSLYMSGSPAVYPQVTEYVGNNTEAYGKTVYDYNIISDEQLPSQGSTYRWRSADTFLRSNSWRTGMLSSKEVFKKEGNNYIRVSSLSNTYKDINTAEYRNLRASQYISIVDVREPYTVSIPDVIGDFCRHSHIMQYFNGSTPYDYYNYYTTTGLRVLASTTETTDGVTTYTYYNSYNKTGLPTQITRSTSTGENIVTKYKYPTELTGTVYRNMKSANILTPVIEKETYKNGTVFLEKEVTNYNSFGQFYAPETHQVHYQNGTTETRMKYNYDTKGNLKEVIKDGLQKTVYLWGYNHMYPIAEICNATYAEVTSKIPESTIKTIAESANPSSTHYNLINGLRTSLPKALITTHQFIPMVGVTLIINPSGFENRYEYDDFGRLKCIKDDYGKIIESYNYNYKR